MKILRINADGFLKCGNNFTLDFVPSSNKTEEDKEYELSEIASNLYTFNTIGIVGKNASGKTTTIRLLKLVYQIFSKFRIANEFNKLLKGNLILDITFYHEGYLYRYKTELIKDLNSFYTNNYIFNNEVITRRLYKKSYSSNLFDYEKYEEVNLDSSLPKDTSKLYNLFKEQLVVGLSNEEYEDYSDYTYILQKYFLVDNDYELIKSILKILDPHIIDILQTDEDKFKITYNNKKFEYVNNNSLFTILSSGTSKGLDLFANLILSLRFGVDFIVDEIENHFHRILVENIINLYKDKSVNKKGATLIFTTHYPELLDLFSRFDNIYVSKYEDEITLTKMSEFDNLTRGLKSKQFTSNVFGTNVNYEALMEFKKGLMK